MQMVAGCEARLGFHRCNDAIFSFENGSERRLMVNIFCLHLAQPGSLPTSTGFKTFWSLKLSIVRHSSSLFSYIVLLQGGVLKRREARGREPQKPQIVKKK